MTPSSVMVVAAPPAVPPLVALPPAPSSPTRGDPADALSDTHASADSQRQEQEGLAGLAGGHSQSPSSESGDPLRCFQPSTWTFKSLPLVCQMPGCGRSLVGDKTYCQRRRICRDHIKMPALIVAGVLSRFCSQVRARPRREKKGNGARSSDAGIKRKLQGRRSGPGGAR